jgi:hypothetical protein
MGEARFANFHDANLQGQEHVLPMIPGGMTVRGIIKA